MAGRRPFARLRALLSPLAKIRVDRETEQLRSELDFERSKNERVADVLSEHGDPLDQERPVQHWAYFPTEQSRAQFVAFITGRYAGISTSMNPISVGKEYCVSFWHTGLVDPESMTDITGSLSLAAQSCGGEYDGWETQVIA